MSMVNTYNFNLNKTLVVSALLHASLFAAAVFFSVKTIQPLPIGVEFNYDATKNEKPAAAAPAVAVPVTKKEVVQETITKDDVTKKSNKPTEAAPSTQTTASTNQGTQTAVASGREGVANGSEVSTEERYLYELKKLLERRKNYPMMAKKMGHAGTVTMRFTLNADGTVAESEVVGKAPYETLNQAAITLVQSINGLKPFPSDIHRDSWSITVPIEYKLN